MNGYLHPTFYIIDTENDFYMCTKDVNLKIGLNKLQKEKVYHLVEKLKKHSDGDVTEQLDPFELQIFQLLIKKKFYIYHVKRERAYIPAIRSITGPTYFLEVVKKEWEMEESLSVLTEDTLHFTHHEREEKQFDLTVHICENTMYIYKNENIKVEKSKETINRQLLRYAAYVFVEKLESDNLNMEDLERNLLKIDLSMYTNEVENVPFTFITYENYLSSYWADKNLRNVQVEINEEVNFPLTTVNYKDQNWNNTLTVLGFDVNDAINNLLTILMNEREVPKVFHYGQFSKKPLDENNLLFFTKYIEIKLRKKMELLSSENKVGLNLDLDVKWVEKRDDYNEWTLLLTLYENNMQLKQEVMVHANS
ncbi:hypothetical protein [Bacillus sp. FJAT-45066]|uniref:hypothetical protein n=1 Tax=Bacillus sp. FJAT-45066 TaxID=2011010 RepID=UPI000BB8085C|nr:hypothetical protein [Bacillus sp. FJAT-45066]